MNNKELEKAVFLVQFCCKNNMKSDNRVYFRLSSVNERNPFRLVAQKKMVIGNPIWLGEDTQK